MEDKKMDKIRKLFHEFRQAIKSANDEEFSEITVNLEENEENENKNQQNLNEENANEENNISLDKNKESKKTEKIIKRKKSYKEKLDLLEKFVLTLIEENKALHEAKLMAIADSQNIVKRFQIESLNIRKYGAEKVATEILPPIDTFKLVLSKPTDNPELQNYLKGFQMIINQIDQALINAGVSEIKTSVGDDFSAEFHTAIEQVETEAVESGKICQIISNGYRLYDRVIKHVAVKVAK